MDSASEKRALLQSLCPGTFRVFINVLSCWIVSVGDHMYGHLRKNDNVLYWTKGTSGRVCKVGMERECVEKKADGGKFCQAWETDYSREGAAWGMEHFGVRSEFDITYKSLLFHRVTIQNWFIHWIVSLFRIISQSHIRQDTIWDIWNDLCCVSKWKSRLQTGLW